LRTAILDSPCATQLIHLHRPVKATLLVLYLLAAQSSARPNIVLIVTDDLGYGDLGCYGATQIPTPNIDRIAAEGILFTRSYAPASTCTPTRYAIMTGEYSFRQKSRSTTILDGDAPLSIDVGRSTLPEVLRRAGYETALVGKWHLGIGDGKAPVDFNGRIAPGPLEVGFDHAFYIPATVDRVPCVFIEDHSVRKFEPSDPIHISYSQRVGNDLIASEHPERLKYPADQQHSGTIVNGISRIGYMAGGENARWTDEDIADVLANECKVFIERTRSRPFFLLLGTHDPHVPHAPNARFAGKSKCGSRGDSIVQLDWLVGSVMQSIRRSNLDDSTLVIVTSDNGPTVFDGYFDGSVEALGDHHPAGKLHGGKYLAFEGGCRIPLLVRWPGTVKPGTSDQMISLVDLLPSLAKIAGVEKLPTDLGSDSLDVSSALLDSTALSPRDHVVLQGVLNTLAIVRNGWKLIQKSSGPSMGDAGAGANPLDHRFHEAYVESDLLFNLLDDPGETMNVIDRYPAKASELEALLQSIVNPN
jgi:arylsulfatase A-like enzyme